MIDLSHLILSDTCEVCNEWSFVEEMKKYYGLRRCKVCIETREKEIAALGRRRYLIKKISREEGVDLEKAYPIWIERRLWHKKKPMKPKKVVPRF